MVVMTKFFKNTVNWKAFMEQSSEKVSICPSDTKDTTVQRTDTVLQKENKDTYDAIGNVVSLN